MNEVEVWYEPVFRASFRGGKWKAHRLLCVYDRESCRAYYGKKKKYAMQKYLATITEPKGLRQ